jgi:proteasome lid subunit RPN8/RPN11
VRIEITASVLGAIRAAADVALPNECCGLLVGRRDGALCRITRAVAAANVADDPARRFEVDPAVLLATHRLAREAGDDIIGPYHSHPGGPAEPSMTDTLRARDGAAPGDNWLIVGADATRAYAFDGDNFIEADLVEVPET